MSTRTSKTTKCRCAGLSLIELMIGQAMSLVVIAAALGLISPLITGFRAHSAIANVQESGRIALDELAHHIRQAGYSGCNPDAVKAVVLDPTHPDVSPSTENWAFEHYRVKGIDAMDLGSSRALFGNNWHQRRHRSGNSYIGDLIMVRSTEGRELRVIRHDPHAQSFQFEGDVTDLLNMGQIIELNDCVQSTTLQIDRSSVPAYNSASDSTLVNYSAEVTVNCSEVGRNITSTSHSASKVLLGGTNLATCNSSTQTGYFTEYQYRPGTTAHKVTNSVYYVGRRDDSGDSYLYRTSTANDGARVYTEALVEGIENLRALYGVDRDQDGTPETYWRAARFNDQPEMWSQVVSVRIWLMINTATAHVDSNKALSVAFPDHTGQIVDCDEQSDVDAATCPHLSESKDDQKFYMRKVIETEIYLRNPQLS